MSMAYPVAAAHALLKKRPYSFTTLWSTASFIKILKLSRELESAVR